MLRGDIANQRSFAFGFRVENSLLQFRENGLIDHALNFFQGKYTRADVNEAVLSIMKYIYWNTEYTVCLVIDHKNYTDEAKAFLDDFPFNQVVNVHSPSEVTMMLNSGELSYLVDDCDESRYRVQSSYAMTSQEINSLLRRHYGRLT